VPFEESGVDPTRYGEFGSGEERTQECHVRVDPDDGQLVERAAGSRDEHPQIDGGHVHHDLREQRIEARVDDVAHRARSVDAHPRPTGQRERVDPAGLGHDAQLHRCAARHRRCRRIEPALGDARLVLEREPPQQFDVIAVDAFSSDSIPVHLLTREALAVYARHLSKRGAVVFHITNRYLDLSGVLRQLADEVGMHAVRFSDEPPQSAVQYRSDWIALTPDAAFAATLREAGGEALPATRGTRRAWTDDHHNLFEVLK
jgi:hypothetical protein